MTTTHRLAPGLYRTTDDRYRIERVAVESRAAGYSDGWHLFDDSDSADPYVDTFATKADALVAIDENEEMERRCDHGKLLGTGVCWACDQDEYEGRKSVTLIRTSDGSRTETTGHRLDHNRNGS